MADDRIGGYAEALLAVAAAEGASDVVENELFRIAEAIRNSESMMATLGDRHLPVERRQAVVEDLLGSKASPTTTALVSMVVGTGRGADLPEIVDGDKRILLVDGEPVPYALARIPSAGETRGNLAAGGRGEGRELTTRDRWIAEQVGPELKKRGLVFVGIDVIGDYLTEINVTCPTCIRELDAQFSLDIAGNLIDTVLAKLNSH